MSRVTRQKQVRRCLTSTYRGIHQERRTTIGKKPSRYVFPSDVKTAIDRATFGKYHTEAELVAEHMRWNELLRKLSFPVCEFYPNKRWSGCRLPMCPRCGLRARHAVANGLLKWAWRRPTDQYSIIEYMVLSSDLYSGFDALFAPEVQRLTRGRTSSGIHMVANIVTSALTSKQRRAKLVIAGEDSKDREYWTNRRIAILAHTTPPKRRRPKLMLGDESTMILQQHTLLDDMLKNPAIDDKWLRDKKHFGRIALGELFTHFDRIYGFLRSDSPDVPNLLGMLRGKPIDGDIQRQRRYYRVNEAPASPVKPDDDVTGDSPGESQDDDDALPIIK